MRKLFAMLTVVALATGMTACSDDDGTETPKDPTTTNFNLRARGGNVMVTLTTSDYTIDIPAADADWIGLSEQSQGEVVVLSVKPNTTGAERSTTVTLAEKTTGTTLAYMNIKQSENSLYSGDFLIEESFFTSCPLPATGKVDKAHGDQYIKIRNNTDQDLYADGLLIITSSKITSVQNISFNEGEDPRPNYCIVDEILCIPGDGDDVLVKARRVAPDLQQRPEPQGDQSQLLRSDLGRFRVVQRVDSRIHARYRQPQSGQSRHLVHLHQERHHARRCG